MQRTTQLVVAAGIAGAVFTTAIGHFLASPAEASASWDRPTGAVESKTGTVDVLGLLEVMLDYEPYKSERETETQGWNAQIEPLAAQRDATMQSLQQLDPNAPDQTVAQGLYEQYQQLDQRIRMLSQQASQSVDQFSARQLADAYKKVHDAVQVVAEAQGIDRVYSSRMTGEGIAANNTNVVVQEVLLRPVLRDAGAVDMTDMVREHLGIPDAPAETPAEGPAVEPAPVPQPAPAGDGN